MKKFALKCGFGITRTITFLLITFTVLSPSSGILAQESTVTGAKAVTVFDSTAETPDVDSAVPTDKKDFVLTTYPLQ